MYDVKFITQNKEMFIEFMHKRGLNIEVSKINTLDTERRKLVEKIQLAQSKRNDYSKIMGQKNTTGSEIDIAALKQNVAQQKNIIETAQISLQAIEAELHKILEIIPNLPMEDIPYGESEEDNVEIRRVGDNTEFKFPVRPHWELGANMKLMDFSTATKLAGTRFVLLKGNLAKLERAIANFMLDLHTQEFGYQEISPPLLVSTDVMFGTGQLPKFVDDQFKTIDDKWLIPTAEVPLTNIASQTILQESDLPLRYTAFTPCFRREAGAAGRDTRGMLRQHQFYKVELVSIVHPDNSQMELERLLNCAEEVLKRLALPYRVMLLCTGDMGFSSQKTYDIEAWLPSEGKYREISSCSLCGDFQARRMQAKFKSNSQNKATQFVHTLNGSGLAVGRTMIAIMENYQQFDGSIFIPEVLRPYMGGAQKINKEGELEKYP